MDAEENQRQVFLRAHSPWKSQTTRFPHSHSRCSAWKSGKPKAGFPLSHWLSLLFNQIKKGNPAADRFAPASRLILQLENAVAYTKSPNWTVNASATGQALKSSRYAISRHKESLDKDITSYEIARQMAQQKAGRAT